jgi:hypothetical protein
MQVKFVRFSTDSGLLPLLITTPKWAKMNGPEENQVILGNSNGISGPTEYRSQCDLLMLRGRGRDGKSIAILNIKREMPGVWLRL